MPDSPLPRTPFDDLDETAVLCAQDVADRLGVEARSVRRAINRGDLPASRACGLRILAADAADWWRSRRIAPPTDSDVETPVEPRPALVQPPKPVAKRPDRSRPAYGARLPLPPRGGGVA